MRTPVHPVTVFAERIAAKWRADGAGAAKRGDTQRSETLLTLADALVREAVGFLDEKLTTMDAAVASGYASTTMAQYVCDGNLKNVGENGEVRIRRGDLKYPGAVKPTRKWEGTVIPSRGLK